MWEPVDSRNKSKRNWVARDNLDTLTHSIEYNIYISPAHHVNICIAPNISEVVVVIIIIIIIIIIIKLILKRTHPTLQRRCV